MNNRELKLEIVSPTSIKCGGITWRSLDTKLVGKTKALLEENKKLKKELDGVNITKENYVKLTNRVGELEESLEAQRITSALLARRILKAIQYIEKNIPFMVSRSNRFKEELLNILKGSEE